MGDFYIFCERSNSGTKLYRFSRPIFPCHFKSLPRRFHPSECEWRICRGGVCHRILADRYQSGIFGQGQFYRKIWPPGRRQVLRFCLQPSIEQQRGVSATDRQYHYAGTFIRQRLFCPQRFLDPFCGRPASAGGTLQKRHLVPG